MRVYLAGPINGCDDAEANDWRTAAKARLSHTFDPMARDYRSRELIDGAAHGIVEGDKRDIDACDVLLAQCCVTRRRRWLERLFSWPWRPWRRWVTEGKPSVGTSMEVLYAWERGKRVVVVAPYPMSPWLIYHAHVTCETLDAALEYLEDAA